MEANLKLKKKKRVAHTGSKLPHMSCEESKLAPDDFVYNIMKEMDQQKSIVSYHQSQFQSQKRKDQTEDNFSYQKKPKKMLPKKIFPLMKKTQTSLKHLKKNRCIPKPRAHVGYVSKAQFKPNLTVENKMSKFQHSSASNITNSKQSISKSENNVSRPVIKICKSSFKKSENSHPDFKVGNSSKLKSCVNKEAVNHVNKKAPVDQLSSSDDNAFEHFVQKANEKDSDSSDSDTDSRLIIRRKRSISKSNQKKKLSKDLLPVKKINTCVSKITSRPLSDSSESEGSETFGVVKHRSYSFKRRKNSKHELPMQIQKNTKKNIPDEVTPNSNLSEEDPLDIGDINYDSDSESNLETPISCLIPITRSQPFDYTEKKSCKNIKENEVTHSPAGMDIADTKFDCNSCYSEPIKIVPKYEMPCHVCLIRDPEIDKIAISLSSTTPIFSTSITHYSSDDDCIVISENSDNEDLPEALKSQSDSSFSSTWPCKNTEPLNRDVCQTPKQGLVPQNGGSTHLKPPLLNTPDTTNQLQIHNFDDRQNLTNSKLSIQTGFATSDKGLLNRRSLHTEKDVDECIIVHEKSELDVPQKLLELSDSPLSNKVFNSDLFSQASNELSSLEQEDNIMNSEIGFNVKIVDVQSLTELNESLIEPSAPECNDIEVIELSDEELSDIQESNTVEEKTGLAGSLKIQNQNESAGESDLALEGDPNQKILEILSKIDFECIKVAISNIKIEKSKNGSCKGEENSTCSNLPLPSTSLPMLVSGKNIIIGQEINSQVKNLNESPDKLSDFQQGQLVNNIAYKHVSNYIEKDFQMNNQTLEKDVNKSRLEVGMSRVNNENINSLINVSETEMPSEVLSQNLIKEAKSFQKVYCKPPSSVEHNGMLAINSKQNVEYVSKKISKNVQNCKDTFSNDLKAIETPTKGAVKNSQQDSDVVSKANTSQVTITNNKKDNVPELTGKCEISKARNEKSIQNRIIHPVKKEVIESHSNELDELAALYISDFKPSNKTTLHLLDLYKKEYARYKQILNTETDVSAGLKLLHDNQVNKLKHIHAAVQNLAKHDACYHKVYQEDCCNKIITSQKNEIKDKGIVKIENNGNTTELKYEEPLPEKNVEVPTKLDPAESSREKMLRLIRNLKCAQCGKPATARCQGCAEIYYCSSDCGEQSWRQGHYAVCRKT